MLKVLAVVDKENTAIDRLAQGLKPYMEAFDYQVVSVHPKRPDEAQLNQFEQLAQQADIIDYQYFRSAEMLRDKYPWLHQKKSILTHYNPYSITEGDWSNYQRVVACNKTINKALQGSEYISLAVDANFWTYNDDWKPGKTVLMVANRIESKKGILEVAIACGDLGLKFVLVGAISDRSYFESIVQTGSLEFYEQVSDEKLRELYYSATVHVCNSKDNFESGTLPILESMLSGTPVLTRNVGHVPDIYNEENLTIFNGQPDNVVALTEALDDMLSDKKALEKQRGAAWQTAKNFTNARRAYQYQRLYRSLIPGQPVSIIVPIYDKPDTIRACLNAIAEQDYENIELLVVDDNPESNSAEGSNVDNGKLVKDFAELVSFPVRYLDAARMDDYGLARARNMGIVEATGDLLVFCDQRMIMSPNAVSEFVRNAGERTWLYGEKGGNKKNFVENFSCVPRTDIIEAGMFCERIDKYGGMSQEVRSRTRSQGIIHVYLPSATAIPYGKSGNRSRKRSDIIEMKDKLFKMGL